MSMDVNLAHDWIPSKVAQSIGVPFPCTECDFVADSKNKLAVHLFNAHATGKVVRKYVDTNYRMVCLQNFGARHSTMYHIQDDSRRCRFAIFATCAPLNAEVTSELDKQDAAELRGLRKRGLSHRAALTKAVRLAGPLSHAAHLVGVDHRTLLKRQTAQQRTNPTTQIKRPSGIREAFRRPPGTACKTYC